MHRSSVSNRLVGVDGRDRVRMNLLTLEDRNAAGSLLDLLNPDALGLADLPAHPTAEQSPVRTEPAVSVKSAEPTDSSVPTEALERASVGRPFVADFSSDVVALDGTDEIDPFPVWVQVPAGGFVFDAPQPTTDGADSAIMPVEVGSAAQAVAVGLDTGNALTGFNSSFSPSGYNWTDIVTSAKVQQVTWSGADLITVTADPGTDPPHWLDLDNDGVVEEDVPGERALPVAYPRDRNVIVEAKFTPSVSKWPYLPPNYNTMVKAHNILSANQPYFHTIPPTPVYPQDGLLWMPPMVLNNPFPDTVNYGQLILDWEFSNNGGISWTNAGRTVNELYVTLDTPVPPQVYHTSIHVGTMPAAGMSTEAAVIDKVWKVFESREVKSKKGDDLRYYKKWNIDAMKAEDLMKKKDGQCGVWTEFFLDTLAAEGISREKSKWVLGPKSGPFDMLVIKNWEFTGNGTSGNASFPYQNDMGDADKYIFDKEDPVTKGWSYFWGGDR